MIRKIYGDVMLMTRPLCMILGVTLVLLSWPIGVVVASVPQGEPFMPGWHIIGGCIAVGTALASGFLMFALVANTRKTIVVRLFNAALLLLPLGSGWLLLKVIPNVAFMFMAASSWVLLLCCTSAHRTERCAKGSKSFS